jgi:hypothetical protein
MTKPDISISTTTQIRIQPHPTYWFTVECSYIDAGYDGFTISYWEVSEGKEKRYNCVYVDKDSALAVADAIYKLFKEDS